MIIPKRTPLQRLLPPLNIRPVPTIIPSNVTTCYMHPSLSKNMDQTFLYRVCGHPDIFAEVSFFLDRPTRLKLSITSKSLWNLTRASVLAQTISESASCSLRLAYYVSRGDVAGVSSVLPTIDIAKTLPPITFKSSVPMRKSDRYTKDPPILTMVLEAREVSVPYPKSY